MVREMRWRVRHEPAEVPPRLRSGLLVGYVGAGERFAGEVRVPSLVRVVEAASVQRRVTPDTGHSWNADQHSSFPRRGMCGMINALDSLVVELGLLDLPPTSERFFCRRCQKRE